VKHGLHVRAVGVQDLGGVVAGVIPPPLARLAVAAVPGRGRRLVEVLDGLAVGSGEGYVQVLGRRPAVMVKQESQLTSADHSPLPSLRQADSGFSGQAFSVDIPPSPSLVVPNALKVGRYGIKTPSFMKSLLSAVDTAPSEPPSKS
jgi:hypothetical protein